MLSLVTGSCVLEYSGGSADVRVGVALDIAEVRYSYEFGTTSPTPILP